VPSFFSRRFERQKILALANVLAVATHMAVVIQTATTASEEGCHCCQSTQQPRRSSWRRIMRKGQTGGHADCDDYPGGSEKQGPAQSG
jgi:hypothetical protein